MNKEKAIIMLEVMRLDYTCPCAHLEETKTAKECLLYRQCTDVHDALVVAIEALREDEEDDLR